MDYNTERENNIIKNIAKDIIIECTPYNLEVTLELAQYLVKLKILNPKNGFTASEVMPRVLTQQLVMAVVEDLKQDTPAMNCIRMQVYWKSINMTITHLQKEYIAILTEKAETYLTDLLNLDGDNAVKFPKLLGSYILVVQNLGSVSNQPALKETMAAFHSVLKDKDYNFYFKVSEERKLEIIKSHTNRITGIRLYLKSVGKAGDGIEDIKGINWMIGMFKDEIKKLSEKIYKRIEEVREVIMNVIQLDVFFEEDNEGNVEIYLPPECDQNDLKYLKQVLVIMLQHSAYLKYVTPQIYDLSDCFLTLKSWNQYYLRSGLSPSENNSCKMGKNNEVLQKSPPTNNVDSNVDTILEVQNDLMSKVEEIDGNANFLQNDYRNLVQKLQDTIQEREAIPTSEVYDDFERLGEIWLEIQTYFYCLETVEGVFKRLEEINKKDHFQPTQLEKVVGDPLKRGIVRQKSDTSGIPSAVALKDSEDFALEFSGFCAWTLYFGEGFLLPGNHAAGIYQYRDQYYAFSSKSACEQWSKNPNYYLMHIYEYLRYNTEMIDLLNAYDNLYNVKSQQLIPKARRKISTRTEGAQTVVHPVEKCWDKDYTFSEWELKKRALTLSRLVKCVTKSVQTVNHSHFRASIGLMAAPDKDKEVQTKRDSSCVHSTISNYLYGLRGHKDDKFKVIKLTRPVEETCVEEIILERGNLCKHLFQEKVPQSMNTENCFSQYEYNKKCDFSNDYSDETINGFMNEG